MGKKYLKRFCLMFINVSCCSIIYAAESLMNTVDMVDVEDQHYISLCPSNAECALLGGECIECQWNSSAECSYGSALNITCNVKKFIHCKGASEFQREVSCEYCYQVDEKEHDCDTSRTCDVYAAPPHNFYTTNCTVKSSRVCLGSRTFFKRVRCNWTSGVRWKTAFILSITLGGFGADRFYLGHWREGIGKLFSFGGLGVWTLVDIFLVGIGYVTPADGSIYLY